MLDTPRTWRYQSAVLLGPRPNLPDQPNSGPEEGWGAPFERPFARMVLHGSPAAENSFFVSLLFSLWAPEISSSRRLARVAHAGSRLSTSVATHSPPHSGSGGIGACVRWRSSTGRAPVL